MRSMPKAASEQDREVRSHRRDRDCRCCFQLRLPRPLFALVKRRTSDNQARHNYCQPQFIRRVTRLCQRTNRHAGSEEHGLRNLSLYRRGEPARCFRRQECRRRLGKQDRCGDV